MVLLNISALLWCLESGTLGSQSLSNTFSHTSLRNGTQSDTYKINEKIRLVTCGHTAAGRGGLHIGEYNEMAVITLDSYLKHLFQGEIEIERESESERMSERNIKNVK